MNPYPQEYHSHYHHSLGLKECVAGTTESLPDEHSKKGSAKKRERYPVFLGEMFCGREQFPECLSRGMRWCV